MSARKKRVAGAVQGAQGGASARPKKSVCGEAQRKEDKEEVSDKNESGRHSASVTVGGRTWNRRQSGKKSLRTVTGKINWNETENAEAEV